MAAFQMKTGVERGFRYCLLDRSVSRQISRIEIGKTRWSVVINKNLLRKIRGKIIRNDEELDGEQFIDEAR